MCIFEYLENPTTYFNNDQNLSKTRQHINCKCLSSRSFIRQRAFFITHVLSVTTPFFNLATRLDKRCHI